MKQRLPSGFLKRSLQLLLSASLAAYLLSTGSLAHASPMTQQAPPSKCPKIPANFDFLHASKQELHRYLLPAAPPVTDSQAYNDWKNGIETTVRTGGFCVNDLKTYPVFNNGRPVKSAPALVNCLAAAPVGTQCSSNWNGYSAGNSTQPGFNEIVGKWNVECVTTSQSPSDSNQSSWVGLGGYAGENLWQVGSGWDPSFIIPFSHYYLWYEAVGQNGTSEQVAFAVTSCGDHIYADIWFAPNNPSQNVAFYLTDNGTAYRGTAPSGFSSGYLTADWVDERANCGNNNLYKLADYNYSEWTHAYASPNNPTAPFYSIGQLPHLRWWMADNNGTATRIAWADNLGSETGSGTDNYRAYWEANGSSQCG